MRRSAAKKLVIAIDGPAGSGKSTVARRVAKRLKIPYIDTGAMYRAVTLQALRDGVSLKDKAGLLRSSRRALIRLVQGKRKQKVFLNGRDVTAAIRTPELTKSVFHVAQLPAIRREMVKKQRLLGARRGAVMEGRDIGTVVFPKATHKFYMEAGPRVRARRRYQELKSAGKPVRYSEVLRDLKARDKTDFERKEGPLRCARDAYRVDTTRLTIGQVVDKILATIQLKKTGSSRS